MPALSLRLPPFKFYKTSPWFWSSWEVFLEPLFNLPHSGLLCRLSVDSLWLEKTLFSALIFQLCRGLSEYLVSAPYHEMSLDFERGLINHSDTFFNLWILPAVFYFFHSHFLIIHYLPWGKPLVSFYFFQSLSHWFIHPFNPLANWTCRDVKLIKTHLCFWQAHHLVEVGGTNY